MSHADDPDEAIWEWRNDVLDELRAIHAALRTGGAIARAVAAERERCAKIAEGRAIRWREAAGHDDAPNWTASEIADMWVTVMRLIREGS